jgi:integrase
MAAKKKADKPKRIVQEPAYARATRGPREDGRWYWRAVKYEGAAEIPVWTGWATRDEAIPAIRKALEEAPKTPEAPPNMTLPERPTVRNLMEAWMPAVKARPRVSPKTINTYKRSSRRLLRYAENVVLAEMRSTDLTDIVEQMGRDGLAPGTIRLAFVVFKMAMRWGRPRGFVYPDVEFPRLSKKDLVRDKYTPTLEEIVAVYWRMPTRAWYRPLYRLIWATGGRIESDLGQLRGKDIDVQNNRIRIPDSSKTGARWVYVEADVMAAVAPIVPKDPEGRLFPRWRFRSRFQEQIDSAIQSLADEGVMRMPRWTTYGFRRFAIRSLRRQGVDVVVTAALLGNTPQTIYEAYEQASEDDKRDAVIRAKLGTQLGQDPTRAIDLTRASNPRIRPKREVEP